MPPAQRRRPTIDERTYNVKARTPIATRLVLTVSTVAALALVAPAAASAHARVSPAVSVKGELQLYSLAVPTEKENATTSKIVMTVPSGFGIDSFVPPPPGWTQHVSQTGSGEERGRHAGHVDGRQDADRTGFAVPVPGPAGVGQDLHVPRPADLLRRLDRQLVGLGVVRRARAHDRRQGLARRLERHFGAHDRRADRRRARAGGGRDRPGRARSRR